MPIRSLGLTDAVPDPGILAGRVKGTLVIARMKVLRVKGFRETQELLNCLPVADQAILRGTILPSGWYSASMVTRLEEAIAAAVTHSDRDACFLEMGRFSAEVNFGAKGLRRAYLRRGDPHHVLGCVPKIYASVYEHGHRAYEHTGAGSAVIRSYDREVSHNRCRATVGWLQRLVELSDGTDVRVHEVECRFRGASYCQFVVAWTGL